MNRIILLPPPYGRIMQIHEDWPTPDIRSMVQVIHRCESSRYWPAEHSLTHSNPRQPGLGLSRRGGFGTLAICFRIRRRLLDRGEEVLEPKVKFASFDIST